MTLSNWYRWSNDGQDSFVSFEVSGGAAGQGSLYLANVPASQIALSSYQPFTDLSSLEYLTTSKGGFYWWRSDNSGFYYIDPSDKTNIRLYTFAGAVDQLVFSAGL